VFIEMAKKGVDIHMDGEGGDEGLKGRG